MREGVAAFDYQVQLVNEREKRLILKQKLLNFRAEGWILHALKKELETEFVGFFKSHESFGAAF